MRLLTYIFVLASTFIGWAVVLGETKNETTAVISMCWLVLVAIYFRVDDKDK